MCHLFDHAHVQVTAAAAICQLGVEVAGHDNLRQAHTLCLSLSGQVSCVLFYHGTHAAAHTEHAALMSHEYVPMWEWCAGCDSTASQGTAGELICLPTMV